ncbi:MAG: hypothetical protein IJR52_00815 [Selenomonadaceae bacterium]|nr:hypothetical protein [Selenomonadaceae bacterium]MBQ9496095.1 hypothetical protein [Selenomonadaceae bacterium]
MELATIFLIWLAITIIDNMAKRKKRRLPPPNGSPDFDIPTLPNDPNFPGEEVPIFIDSPQQAEVRPKKISQPPRPKKISPREVHEAQETSELDLNLTPSKVLDTIILSELLDKPKALRRRR